MHKIPISKKQYTELIKSLLVGNWIREAVLEDHDMEFKHLDELESHLLEYAKEFGLEKEMTEMFEGKLISSEALSNETEDTIEEYDDNSFWENLEVHLGKRDFYESMTEKEKEEAEKEMWLPEKVHEYYEKYRKEFEENGIKNLRILLSRKFKKPPVPSSGTQGK